MLTFFIGSYTEYLLPDFGGTGRGIYTVQLNSETGVLTILHIEHSRNPSYLAISDDNKVLYSVSEQFQDDAPLVKSYQIKDDFALDFKNEQPIPGGLPCHLVINNNSLIVACYETGNVLQYPLDVSGKILTFVKNYQHTGSGINKSRQEAPHAHQVAIHPNGEDIYVCDLGIDKVKAYDFQGDELFPNTNKDCEITKGAGPRHLVFNQVGNLAYVLNELTGTISILKNENGVFKETNKYSAIPNNYLGEPSGSAIRMHPEYSFLYAANRKLDAIAIFRIEEDKLKYIDYQYTQGKEVREFNISPNGEWLIACHQNSHDTVVYRIGKNGKLTETYRTKEILSPVCVVFPK